MPRGRQLSADPQLLQAALEGLELQRQRIEDQIRQVRTALGRRSPGRPATKRAAVETTQPQKPARRKRTLSAEARKRIAAAQKKRWANYRKQTEQ
jgi:hypothetical protein